MVTLFERWFLWWVSLAGLLAAGCGGESDDLQGSFAYRCLDLDDVACRGPDPTAPAPMPKAVAVRTNFVVEYTSPVEGTLHAVQAPSEARGRNLGDGSIILQDAGLHSLIARELISDQVSDFVNITAAEVHDVVLSYEPEIDAPFVGNVRLNGPEVVDIYARIMSEDAVPLAGSIIYFWDIADTSICASGFVGEFKHHITLEPRANGSTTLTVGASFDGTSADAVSVQLQLVVEGLP